MVQFLPPLQEVTLSMSVQSIYKRTIGKHLVPISECLLFIGQHEKPPINGLPDRRTPDNGRIDREH